MNTQQIFDKVVDHMRTQGFKGCLTKYIERDSGGNCIARCAKGCLMWNEKGEKLPESSDIVGLLGPNSIVHGHVRLFDSEFFNTDQLTMLDKLECLYAGLANYSRSQVDDTSYWESGFQEIAEEHNLKVPSKVKIHKQQIHEAA